MNRITQAQIARAVGVNKATVSRALCGDPRISTDTAGRVKAAAERLGYRPDPALAAIAAARWRGKEDRAGVTFAHISQLRQPHAGLDALNQQGAAARASELGCRIEHFVLEDHAGAAALQRILVARGIRGLVIAPFFDPKPALDLEWNRFCAVACGISPHMAPLNVVEHDAFDAVLLAWRRVLSYGYRRPGLAILRHAPPVSVEDDDSRRAAALLLHAKGAPGGKVPPLFYSEHDPYDVWVERVVAWYRRWKPDAVIAFNNAVRHILVNDGHVRIPEGTAFAVLTGQPEERLAGIKEQAVEIGRAAVDLLQLALRTNQWGLPHTRIRHYLEPEWIDGETLPRQAGKGE